MTIKMIYDDKKGRCSIQEGDVLSIGEFKVLFTTENNKQVAKSIHNNENISYKDGVNFDEMFTDLMLNNLDYTEDITIERNNEIVFKSKASLSGEDKMDAIEYLKKRKIMCETYTCLECPYKRTNCIEDIQSESPELAVTFVENWFDNHIN